MALIALKGVRFAWPGATQAFSIPTLELTRGERVLLLGESGSGKSTLLSLLSGTARPEAGSITIAGKDITSLPPSGIDRFRADHIGVIFQMFNLLPFASAQENITLPLRFSKQRRLRIPDPVEEAARLMGALGLMQELADQKAGALSVGQQQRVAAARALIGSPELILADEPTSALDGTNATQFMTLLTAELVQSGGTLLMVSHDDRLAPQFDRVLEMADIAHTLPKALSGKVDIGFPSESVPKQRTTA